MNKERVDLLCQYINTIGHVPGGKYYNDITLASEEIKRELEINQTKVFRKISGYDEQYNPIFEDEEIICKENPNIFYNKNDEK